MNVTLTLAALFAAGAVLAAPADAGACSIVLGPPDLLENGAIPKTSSRGDTTPPARVELRGVRVLLVEDPSLPAFACPDVDHLELDLAGGDETTPNAALRVAVFAGPDAAAADRASAPEALHPLDSPDDPRTLRVALGLGVDRQRDGRGLRRAGLFCFSLALVDEAANVGPRSAPSCLDTTDERGPHVQLVDGRGGCGCGTSGGAAGGWLALGLGAVVRRLVRRRS